MSLLEIHLFVYGEPVPAFSLCLASPCGFQDLSFLTMD